MVIKRFSSILGSRHSANPFSRNRTSETTEEEPATVHGADTPEGSASRGVKQFCESGGPNTQGEEVLHLPVIVEAAESSPSAAQAAAHAIRKFLSKDNYSRPHVQYNAIMLIRILSDNPGATFTRNIDQKFTTTIKELLRTQKDPSVQQIMRETLQALYLEKAYDTNLVTLFNMWSKESGLNISQSARSAGYGQNGGFRGQGGYQQAPRASSQPRGRDLALPPPVELAARIEEAKTSAKLLQQLVQSTPAGELQENDLIKEFSERCQNAQRSMQAFMNSTNPSPDDNTMQTLIETSEQLSLAASKHQRAVLQARRSGHSASPAPGQNGYTPPAGPPPSVQNTGYSSPTAAPSSTFTPIASNNAVDYAPPPAPPAALRDNLERRTTAENNIGLGAPPPSLRPAGPPSAPFASSARPPQLPPMLPSVTTDDDPFADSHESYAAPRGPPPGTRTSIEPVSASDYEDDDPYRLPSGHPDNIGASTTFADLAPRPAPPRGPAESWRDTAPGQPDSYHPGYSSTPSYLHRQESSGDHLTMHGAGESPVIAEDRVMESAGRYGRVSPVAERDNRTGSIGEVSPVESRYGAPPGATTGYKY